MAGTVDSVPFLKVGRKSVYFPSHFWWPDAPKCTKLHRFAPIFSEKNSWGNTPGPPKLGRGLISILPRLLPLERAKTVPLFQSFRGRWVLLLLIDKDLKFVDILHLHHIITITQLSPVKHSLTLPSPVYPEGKL